MPDRRFAHQIPRTVLLGALALAVVTPVWALEIDGLKLHSGQGQPLHARALITGPGSENPLRTAVRCLEGACADAQLRSYVAGRAQQTPAVVVRSFSPMRSGFLRIEVEVADGASIAQREFVLQLRSFGESRRAEAGIAATPTLPRAVPGTTYGANPQVPARGENLPLPAAPAADANGPVGGERWVVQPGQTLSGIAAQISQRHGGGTSVWMERLFAANPDAFIRADRNRIRAGANLRFDLPRAGIAEAAPLPLPAPPPEPQPVAPGLPATAPVPTAGTAASSAGAARTKLSELSDDGKALAERLAQLEARIRSLQAELSARESAIEQLQEESSARAQAVTRATVGPAPASVPTSSPASAPPAPVVVASDNLASSPSSVEAGELEAGSSGSDNPVEPTAIAAHAASAGASAADSPDITPVADERPVGVEAPVTAAPKRPGVGWTLMAAMGLVVVVLGLALLLRTLSRSAQGTSLPLRRDDRALKARIQERLGSADARVVAAESGDEGIDLAQVSEAVAGTKKPASAGDTVQLDASTVPTDTVGGINEDEVGTEVDVKIVYGLFDEAEAVLLEALASVPLSPRLLLKLAEVRFYRRDAEALAELALQILEQGQRQPAWLWAKVERLGRELCPDRRPFAQSPAQSGLRSVG